MKEMEYVKSHKRELLERNIYKDHEYFVISFGTHPCGYVKLNGENPTLEDICCHGGITYKESYLRISNEETISGDFIGWDYAHYGDYMGYDESWSTGIKYTTEDIVEECKRVIDELEEIMNREEAIETLKNIKAGFETDEWLQDDTKALDMGIKALENQKIGQWIEKDGYDGDTYYDCSECGESFCLIEGTSTDNLYNYCPNCGAKMEGNK